MTNIDPNVCKIPDTFIPFYCTQNLLYMNKQAIHVH